MNTFDEQLFEASLPGYLKKDISAWEEGLKNESSVLDCLYCELQASINSAFYANVITEKQADHLRRKYLGLEI